MCLIFLIKPQCQKTVVLAAMYQLKRITVAIHKCASFQGLCCLMKRKVKCLKNSASIGIKYDEVSEVTTRVRMLSFGIYRAPQSFCDSFIALPIIRCSKSSQKSPVPVSQVATVLLLWKSRSWF